MTSSKIILAATALAGLLSAENVGAIKATNVASPTIVMLPRMACFNPPPASPSEPGGSSVNKLRLIAVTPR